MGNPQKILYYDSVCVLCNNFLKWVVQHDLQQKFKFSPIGGESFEALVNEHPELKEVDSVIYQNGREVLVRGAAVREVIHELSTFKLWKLITRATPLFLLDFWYKLVAKSRYKMFGKYDSCPPIPPEWKARFLA